MPSFKLVDNLHKSPVGRMEPWGKVYHHIGQGQYVVFADEEDYELWLKSAQGLHPYFNARLLLWRIKGLSENMIFMISVFWLIGVIGIHIGMGWWLTNLINWTYISKSIPLQVMSGLPYLIVFGGTLQFGLKSSRFLVKMMVLWSVVLLAHYYFF